MIPGRLCDGCKYYKYRWWDFGSQHKNRCNHPTVLTAQGVKKNAFCSVALMWPCEEWILKRMK